MLLPVSYRNKVTNKILNLIDIITKKFETIVIEYVQAIIKNRPATALLRLHKIKILIFFQ